MTTYYSVKYDNEASGPFVSEGANLTWTGGVGFVITVVDTGSEGKLSFALVSGIPPTDGLVLTQGSTTADADGDARELLYPAYFREDVQVSAAGPITWTGHALGTTHSFVFKAQTVNVVVGEILTFSGGQTAEVVVVESDAGATGELSVRFITDLDAGLPGNNDTFIGDIAGDGTVDGVVHTRAYRPLELHRLLGDLNTDEDISGNDDLSRVDPTPSGRNTDDIVSLLGSTVINDEVSRHMFGGSISQLNGDTLYSGEDVQVTSSNGLTEPVLIQNGAIITNYWKNAYMPDSIAGNVRILVKTREDGVDIDGKRVSGKLLEFGDSYFRGGTTLGTSTTALALFSSPDGNNETSVATVAGAPYNTITITEGYQLIDYSNGNGATPFGLEIGYGSANSLQIYERTKYIQRRGTSETLFGINAQLVTGINSNFSYDTEVGGPLSENEILAWGTVITYTGQTLNLSLNEVVTFSGGGRGRLIYIDDNGATGTLIFDMEPGIVPVATETMTGLTSNGDGTVGTITSSSRSGTGLLIALDDQGASGNIYYQSITGIAPSDNQVIYGSTSNANVAVAGTVSTRTINNQFIGIYTGSNTQTNFGIAIDPTDAILGDKSTNLLNVVQEPPNNQTGTVDSLLPGDAVTVYPWDGVTLDINGNAEPTYDEMTLAAGLTAGVSTIIDVGAGNIPDNTPQSGFLRVERNSDNNLDLVAYSSHNGDDEYTLVGAAPSDASIGNTVMRAFIDVETATTFEDFTTIFGPTSTQVAITVLNGSTLNGPIKVFKTTSTFGPNGFTVSAIRQSDA